MPRTNERSFHCEEVRQKYFKQNRGHDDSLVPTISERQFQALMTKLDRLENKLGILISKVIEEVNNGNKSKDLPLNKFFSRFRALKGLDEDHPTARRYKTGFNQFLKFLGENYPRVKNLNELEPIMISKFVRHLKARQVYSRKRDRWEKLADRTINGYIKKLRHTLEVVDKAGTQELREPIIMIRRPHLKKNPYIPTDEELAKRVRAEHSVHRKVHCVSTFRRYLFLLSPSPAFI